MGSGSSSMDRQIENQERYVSQNLSKMKKSLPIGHYSDQQIKARLRQKYCGETYREKDSFVIDRHWNKAMGTRQNI